MEAKFKVGDVVQLKSGGTRMTIEEVDDDQVACTWFERKKLERATFIAGALIKYQPRQGGVISSRRVPGIL